MISNDLKVFAIDDSEWVVASDHDDAIAVWCENMGEKIEDYQDCQVWAELDPKTPISIIVDEHGEICDQYDRVAMLTMPAAAWAIKEGRGWLCGTEE